MSKFLDAVELKLTGKQEVPGFSQLHVTKKHDKNYGLLLDEYRLSVLYSQSGFCKKEDLPHMQKLFIHTLRHKVYGDIEDLFFRLERAVYEQDAETAQSVIRDMRTELFG